MTEWVCTNCGSSGAHPIENKLGSFTQFDDRYTTGYCDVCSVANPEKPRKTPRPTHTLIKADHFDHDKFVTTKEKAELANLVRAFAGGGSSIQMSDQQTFRLVTLYDKYGAPGFIIQPWVRAAAEKYASTQQESKAMTGHNKKRRR